MIDRRSPIGRRAADHPALALRAFRDTVLMVAAAFGIFAAGAVVGHVVLPPMAADTPSDVPVACDAALAAAVHGDCR